MGGGNRPSFSNPNSAGATSFGMTSENFGYSSMRLKRVKKLQFGVINPDELVSYYIVPVWYLRHIYYNRFFFISIV